MGRANRTSPDGITRCDCVRCDVAVQPNVANHAKRKDRFDRRAMAAGDIGYRRIRRAAKVDLRNQGPGTVADNRGQWGKMPMDACASLFEEHGANENHSDVRCVSRFVSNASGYDHHARKRSIWPNEPTLAECSPSVGKAACRGFRATVISIAIIEKNCFVLALARPANTQEHELVCIHARGQTPTRNTRPSKTLMWAGACCLIFNHSIKTEYSCL